MFDLLRLTSDEAWALHDFIRQHDKLGCEWDRGFMRRVHRAILETQAAPGHDVSLMVLSPDELWQIDRQIPSGLMVGTQNIGRKLLSKAMALLKKMEDEDDGDDDPSAREDDARHEPAGGPAEAALS